MASILSHFLYNRKLRKNKKCDIIEKGMKKSIEKGIKKDQLIADGMFSRATLTKMNKNENVALSGL